ncbi:MAG TPA: alpha-L-rhamnosidase C-terminal domain-containing protein, partial [Flavisolibacter sp.]|nr:alpha-L-rhamnosidase C-terminal domain-containing protein [Flavisolibacter sp.]
QGKIYSGWRIEKNSVLFQVEIPANTTAVIVLPVRPGRKYLLKEGNTHILSNSEMFKAGKVYGAKRAENSIQLSTGSGSYTYQIYYQQ